MNILIVVPWDEECGGVVSVVGNLALQLKRKGHKVAFLHPSSNDLLQDRTTKWSFPGYTLNLRPPFVAEAPIKSIVAFVCYLFLTIRQLISLLSQNKIDIVNIHYPVDDFVYFAIIRKFFRFKLVVSVHGADIFPIGKPRETYSKAFQLLMNSADLLVAPSQSTLNEVVGVFPSLRAKAIFIHNAVNMVEFQPSTFTPQPHSNYVLCVANHNFKKAVDVLLRAFKQLSQVYKDLELWLVGDGPLRGELEQLARELELSNKVKFWGFRNREEIRNFIHQCNVFVLPSRAEPFGIVIIEALACRKPVVATTVGGIPEIIQNGINGILVQSDSPGALFEAAQAVLQDNELRHGLARRGYESVKQRFQWEIAGDKYELTFCRLLNSKHHPKRQFFI